MTDRHNNISRIVKMLMAMRGLDQAAVARSLHVTQPAVSRALTNRRRWTLDELDELAALFEVPVTIFFEEPEELLRSRCFAETPGLAA